MQAAPIPEDEENRLKDLAALGLLDTPSEDRFDQISKLAVRILGVKQAKISLVDSFRVYFKSNTNCSDPTESPRTYSTCAHAINHPTTFIVPDMREDDRFADREDVMREENATRFYASIVLNGPSGHPVGTFCVIDSRPRYFRDHQMAILKHLGEIAQHELLRGVRESYLGAELTYHSKYDMVTGLANREGVMEMLSDCIAHTEKEKDLLAVLLLQFDNHPKVFAAYGPHISDKALNEIAKRINDVARTGDRVGRLGADQFVICLPNITHPGRTLFAADRVLETLSQPLFIDGIEILPSILIGISMCPTDGSEGVKLLQNAQIALESNRAVGVQRQLSHCLFTPSMNVALNERINMERELARAITQNEFFLQYQPKVNLHNGRIIGAEALVRWKHPEKGIIPPFQFIPIAEESGLIVSIGEWVLRHGCVTMRKWLDKGIDIVPVAINVAHKQIKTGKLPYLANAILEETRLPPQYLSMEITEGSFIDDIDFACSQLNQLASIGIELALDDFGTGFSSLSFLRRLPIRTIKIDKSFVQHIDKDRSNYAIVAATFAMAEAMQLDLIAEGMETEEERRILTEIGYGYGQGYLFSKPLNEEDFLKLIHTRMDIKAA